MIVHFQCVDSSECWMVLNDLCIWTGLLLTFSLWPISLILVSFDVKAGKESACLVVSSLTWLTDCGICKGNEQISGRKSSKLGFEGNGCVLYSRLCVRRGYFGTQWPLNLTLIQSGSWMAEAGQVMSVVGSFSF